MMEYEALWSRVKFWQYISRLWNLLIKIVLKFQIFIWKPSILNHQMFQISMADGVLPQFYPKSASKDQEVMRH